MDDLFPGISVENTEPNRSAGDIIQMGFPERLSHTDLIKKVITDEKGRTVDYLVDSNTADLKHVPVSAIPFSARH